MANDLAFAGGAGLMSREDLAKSLNNAAMSMPSAGGDKQFLKMDKNNGDWLFGQEETVVEPNSLWAINPMSLKHGWVAWDTDAGGPPMEEVMVPITRPLPAIDSLPKLGQGKNGKGLEYQQQRSVDLVCVSGEDKGVSVEYKQSSVGAMKLFATITNALLDQLSKSPDDIVGIIKLGFDKYKHKKYGTIHNPDWPFVEWRKLDDTSAPKTETESAKTSEPEQAKRTRTAAPPVEKPADDEPSDEEEALAAEYAANAATEAAAESAVPRRRQRR